MKPASRRVLVMLGLVTIGAGASAFVPFSAVRAQTSSPALPGVAVVAGAIVEGDTRVPVPFARVTLAGTASGVGSSRTVIAGEDGRFAFEAVRAGSYFLAASKPAYVPTYYRGTGPAATDPGPPLVVADGARLARLELTLVRGGVITGRVVDQYGEMAAYAQVRVSRIGVPAVRNSPVYFPYPQGMLSTDVHGIYRVYGLAPGDYLVSATTDTQGTVRVGTTTGPVVAYVPAFYPGVSDPAQATAVSISPGEERTGLDLKLRVATLVSVEGTLAVPEGISYISMNLRPLRPEAGSFPSVSAHADAGWRFRAEHVLPGQYTLTAYASARQSPPVPGAAPPPLFWAALTVTVGDRDVTGLALALQPSMTVSGRVVVPAEGSGGPIDMKQWIVSLMSAPGSALLIGVSSTLGRTDSEGMFTITNVTPGRYRFAVRSATPGVTGHITSVAIDGQAAPGAEFEVRAGANVTGVVVTLRIDGAR